MPSLPTGTPRKCGSISLPLLSSNGTPDSVRHDKLTIKKSRMGKWRAGVLIGVHVLFAIHLGLWFLSGMRDGVRETLSPVEPSESMYTLETGLVNAGFIFFVLAIVSTLVFGRYFCGWGCHIVAVQDFCGWLMKKCGVHPKPFRSRLLVFVPLIVALYMFVWPTFKREVLFPVLADSDSQAWSVRYGAYLGETAKFPGWSEHIIVEDFWKTFAPWYVAIPFVLVCTFGMVYFLGNKGFCTYGCPYGGLFGPADLVSVGKIKVNDNCEGCGHCTAVCSSNVRVHEEVRDFGMVVDPGCMKCMDCVSVCPNEALSFGFAKPSVLTGPRSPEAKERRSKWKGNFDLSWPEEIVLALVFLGLTLGFRGMLNEVPLLMALGMAGIGTFFAWKLIRIVTTKSARIHGFQLKFKGRIRPAGLVFVPLAVLVLASGAWGAGVKWSKWRAEQVATEVGKRVNAQDILGGRAADEDSRALAKRALGLFDRAGPFGAGGWGWAHRPDELPTIGFLQLVLGRPQDTERTMMEIMRRGNPQDGFVFELGKVMQLRGATEGEVIARYEEILNRQPQLAQVRAFLAVGRVRAGRQPEAIKLYEDALPKRPGDPIIRKDFGMLLVQLGQADRGLGLLAEAGEITKGERKGMRVREDPENLRQVARAYLTVQRADLALPILEHLATLKKPKRPLDILYDLANARYFLGKRDEALDTMKQAAAENKDNPNLLLSVAQMYDALGRPQDAQDWARKAQEAQQRLVEESRKREQKLLAP